MPSNKFKLNNPNLGEHDYLYHLGIAANDAELPEKYGDVKFVCMGGKASRMRDFAEEMFSKLKHPKNSMVDEEGRLKDISGSHGRYSMYKVGPVLAFNHGIGMASLSVVFNEILKLLYYAQCETDVQVFRIGSSGGLGIDPGTVVITDKSYDEEFKDQCESIILGKRISYPCNTSESLRKSLVQIAKRFNIPAVEGNTMSCDGFFEEQGRLDGAFCDYTNDEKLRYLNRAHETYGIKNIEMECVRVTALCNRAGLECAIICPALLNRLHGDIVHLTPEQMSEWQNRSFRIVGEYIKEKTMDPQN